MEKELKFNQCQDCGCPGAKLEVDEFGVFLARISCPYCGRKGLVFPTACGCVDKMAVLSWNPYNIENKEGLV